MSFPSKRVFTDAQRVNEPVPVANGIDADLAARLRNMAARVRKNVSEGYTAPAPSTSNVSSVKTKLPFTRSASFQSAKDALREVYETRPADASPASSRDAKRKLAFMDEIYGDTRGEDDDMGLDEEGVRIQATPASRFPAASQHSMRPTKPLPGARRFGMRSQSDGALVFGAGTPSILTADAPTEEEDWSQSFTPVRPEALR